jgi:hypothetical protein
MKPLLPVILLLVLYMPAYSQVDSLKNTPPTDTTSYDSAKHQISPAGPHGSWAHVIISEFIIAGMSAYASGTNSGPKVMGGLYALASAGCLIYIPFYWFNKENRKDPDFKTDRIWNAVTLLGLSVGYAGVARYNLARSDGHSFGTKFANNFLGVNATVIGSVAAGALMEKLLHKKKGNSKVQTYLQWQGNGVSLVVAFK